MTMSRAMGAGVTGLMAHQTKLDNIGNNLANVNTTGFKSGRVLFNDIFYHTVNHGSAPSATNGGINPRQMGHGVMAGQITKNFNQGTLETTGVVSDAAIEGEGFFILEDEEGVNLYSRDGAFARNINNDLVNPSTGYFVQGWNATQSTDGTFTLNPGGALQDVNIPVGESRFARQTTEVTLNGVFNSDGNPLATEGSEITAMSDMYIVGTTEKADAGTDMRVVALTSSSLNPLMSTTNGIGVGGGAVSAYTAGTSMTVSTGLSISSGTQYLVSIGKGPGIGQNFVMDGSAYTSATGVIDLTDTSIISDDISAGSFTTAIDTDSVFSITSLPSTSTSGSIYTPLILSAKKGGAVLQELQGVVTDDLDFKYGVHGTTVGDFMQWMEESLGVFSSAGETIASGGVDAGGSASTVILDDETAGSFAAYASSTEDFILKVVDGTGVGQSMLFEPSTDYVSGTKTITNTGGDWATTLDATSVIVIQRQSAQFDGRVDEDEATPGTKLTEFTTDAVATTNSAVTIDQTEMQTAINNNTLHIGDIIRFSGASGDAQSKIAIITDLNRSTGTISFTVDGDPSGDGLTDEIGGLIYPPKGSLIEIMKPTGVYFSDTGELSISGNLGTHNDLTDITIEDINNDTLIDFAENQAASGESAIASFTVFDSTGNEKEIKVTMYLEARTDSTTSLRWLAESPNDTDLGNEVAAHSAILGSTITEENGRKIGSGRAIFDSDGQFVKNIPSGSETVILDMSAQGAGSTMSFTLDFSDVNALSDGFSDINMSSQDGLAEGVLETFSINVDGSISGIYSNGAVETVAQIAVGRFNNNQGLEALGNNMFGLGPNSGPVQVGVAGTDGRGVIRGGALEASNVELADEFVNLITTQRGFQANARTITTADQILQEVVNLVR